MKDIESLKQFVLDQLSDIEYITTKRMFGGIGFFQNGKMFGMIGGAVFRLKANESNVQKYLELGIKAFMSNEKTKGLPYYEVPVYILENKDELINWAQESIHIAHTQKKKG